MRPTTSLLDASAHRLARDQRGLVSRRQLLAVGIGQRVIHRRLAAGVWREPALGVIDLCTHPLSWEGQLWLALLLAAPDGSWLPPEGPPEGHDRGHGAPRSPSSTGAVCASHLTAAHLHGFLDVPPPRRIELSVPRQRSRRIGAAQLHRVRHLDGTEVAWIGAVPVTSVARTLLDLATVLPEDRLQLVAWDAARRRRSLPAELAATLAAHAGRAGTRQLRRLVDAAWPERKVAVELDGASHHDTPAARARDAARLARLRELGWTVVVLRHADLRDPAASEAIARLRHALRAERGGPTVV